MRLTLFQRFGFSIAIFLVFILAGQFFLSWINHAQTKKPEEQNVLKVGLIDDTPPYCFYNDQNQLVGINIDLVQEVARRMGKRAHIESVSFNRLATGLMTRQYDAVSIGSVTPHRAKVVRYIHPHLESSDVLIVHPELRHLHSLDDFKGHPWKIAVYNGTSYIQLLQDKGLQKNMVIYPNQRDVFLSFYKHRSDAVIMNEDVARHIQKALDPTMVILPEKVRTGRQYAFAVHRDDLENWRKMDQVIQEVVADGTFERIRQKWLSLPESEVQHAHR